MGVSKWASISHTVERRRVSISYLWRRAVCWKPDAEVEEIRAGNYCRIAAPAKTQRPRQGAIRPRVVPSANGLALVPRPSRDIPKRCVNNIRCSG
jgi:hypothetical protein